MVHETLTMPPGCRGWTGWCGAGGGAPLHTHDEWEWNLVVGGRAEYLVAGRRWRVEPGSLLWLFPSQPHKLLDRSRDFAMWIAVFRPDLVAETTSDWAPRLADPEPDRVLLRRLPRPDREHLAAVAKEIHDHRGDPATCNAGLAWALRSAWRAWERAQDATPEPSHPAVVRALDYLHDHPEAGLSDLAAHAGLSPARLSRRFADDLGTSLTVYRNRVRLQRFLDRYRPDGDRDLLHAALDAGFGSYAQFHRVFTAAHGCGPREHFRGNDHPKSRS